MSAYTGNYIGVEPKVVINYVMSLLDDYEYKLNNGLKPDVDPYRESIVMTLEDGRQIEVPEELQRTAVVRWVQQNGADNSIVRSDSMEEETKTDNKKKKGKKCFLSYGMRIAMCLLTIVILMMVLGKIRPGFKLFDGKISKMIGLSK
jgi:hypothetical protein